MKKFIILLTVFATGLGLYSCKDDPADGTIIPADQLFLPRNNYDIDLSKDNAVVFEWETSTTGDDSYITYEVLFDTADGDFSDPLYIVKSASKGYSPEVEIPTSTLRSIVYRAANQTKAVPGTTITIKWTVRVWRGLVSTLYSGTEGSRTLRAVSPLANTLKMEGTSTEDQKAVKFAAASVLHPTRGTYSDEREDGGYECYTKLTEGSFIISDDLGRYFHLDGSGNILVSESETNPTPTAVTGEGIYRVYLNLNTMTYTMKEIAKVEFLLSKNSNTRPELTYTGNGVWVLEDYAWNVMTGNSDSRHKFVCNYADTSVEYWGHYEDDCRHSGDPDANKPALFFNIFRHSYAGEWDNTWKINEGAGEGFSQNVSFKLHMNNTDASRFLYERSFTGMGEMPYPVVGFIAPNANHLIELQNVADITYPFSWTPSSQPQLVAPKYEVVFFSDAAGTKEVGRYAAKNNGLDPSADIPHITLDQTAQSAGIAAEATGTIYWSVISTIYSNSVIAEEAPRAVQIKRLPGMPTSVSLSGTGAEVNVSFSPATIVQTTKGIYTTYPREAGAFECYTRFSTGTYSIVDNQGRYIILETNGNMTPNLNPVTNPAPAAGIYRVYLNFYTMKWTMKQISKVEVWNQPWFGASALKEMDYKGNGVWNVTDYAWNVGTSSQKDTRHHFRVTYADNTKERWASFDDDGRGNANPDSNPLYYKVFRFDTTGWGDDWAQSWKTKNDSEGVQQKATFNLYMNTVQNADGFTYTRSFRD